MKYLLLLACVLCYASATGQDYVFKVMANKGSNMVRTSDDGSWKRIERGDALYQGYWVKISSRSYLGLVHNTGKTAALESPGEFEIASIESSIKNKKKGLGSKYTDFVYEDTGTPDDRIATRGESEALKVLLPPDGEVIHSSIHIRWSSSKSETMELILLGIFEDELARITVEGNYYELDLTMEALEGQETFILQLVSASGVASREHVVNRITPEEQNLLIQAPDESGVVNALDYLLLAGFYEENNLLIDASNFYQQAMLAAPEVQDFQEYYKDFLARNGL